MSTVEQQVTTQAPPGTTSAMPPGPVEATPRTERADWIFVHYLAPGQLTPGASPDVPEHRVTDPGMMAQIVAVVLARDHARSAYPLVWLAAELGSAFEQAYIPPALARMKRTLGGDSKAWDAPLPDLTPVLEAERSIQAMFDEASGLNVDAAADAAYGELRALWERLVPDEAVREYLRDQPWGGIDEATEEGPALAELVRRWSSTEPIGFVLEDVRREAHGRLYPNARQRLLLKRDDGTWETPRGTRMRSEADYRAATDKHVLPVSAERLVGMLRDSHEGHDLEANDGLIGCHAFPSDRTIATMLKEGGFRSPSKPAESLAPVAPRRPKGRAVQVTADTTIALAATAAFRETLKTGIEPTLKAIVQYMRASGAKGKDRTLTDAYREVEAYYEEHGDLPS